MKPGSGCSPPKGWTSSSASGSSSRTTSPQLAKEYPNVKFAGVDYAVSDRRAGQRRSSRRRTSPRSSSARRRDRFSSARLPRWSANSKKVGFVGGMDIPLIHKFEAGFRAGVKHVCPDCTVIAQYAGVTPEAFRNPGRGKELALSQYQSGVNIIFHASGSTGLGVFEAARSSRQARDRRGRRPVRRSARVHPDVDGEGRGRGRVRRDPAREGRHVQGRDLLSSGWPKAAWVTSTTRTTRRSSPTRVRARLDALQAEIVAGKIDVPSTR